MITAGVRVFFKTYAWIIRIGLITGAIIVVFQVISLFVIYRYLQLDYYLSLVAVAFLAVGLALNKGHGESKGGAEAGVGVDTEEVLRVDLEEVVEGDTDEVLQGDSQKVLREDPVGRVADLLALLTSKEFLVLQLLAEGKTNKEIAAASFVEISTVKTHVHNIYAKLAVTKRAEARARYVEMTRKLPFF